MTAKPTSAKPITIEGETFHCYRTGISRFEWRNADGSLSAGRRSGRTTYFARVRDETLVTRFRSLEAAMRGAIKKRSADR